MDERFTAINLNKDNLIYPLFIVNGKAKTQAIRSFPGVFRYSLDRLMPELEKIDKLGLRKILLFGIPDKKDAFAKEAYKDGNLISEAVRQIKARFPHFKIITDVCLCAYTTHGHCGIISRKGNKVVIDKKKTLDVLAKIALSHAYAGANFVAPSAMTENQVKVIRENLDKHGLKTVKILGYSAKFASNFYGPFRNACASSPAFGDRSSYQLGFDSLDKALNEISQDIKEGADIVMVKPSLSYLDVIHEAKKRFSFPLAAYLTSGEYALVEYGARQKLWDRKKVIFEIISALRRAGADFIISYHAREVAEWLAD